VSLIKDLLLTKDRSRIDTSRVTGHLLEGDKYTGYHLKNQKIYRSKKNAYGITNTYRTVPIPVSSRNTFPILLYLSPTLHCVPCTVLCSAASRQFYRNTYRKKINIPKYLKERNRNAGILPSIEKYWKVTKIPTKAGFMLDRPGVPSRTIFTKHTKF
jgi:hypothetical protein